MTTTQRPPAASQTPSETDPPPEPWGWTPAHRIALGILLAALLTILIIQFIRRPIHFTDPLTLIPGNSSLPTRIDPNSASEPELSRIPHIGPKLAAAIVTYRQARQPAAPAGIVFARLEDLDRVPGIGKTLLQQLTPYLDFPEPTPEIGGGAPSTNTAVP